MKKIGYFCNVLILAATAFALSGCGQKGPLVLPDEKPANHKAAK